MKTKEKEKNIKITLKSVIYSAFIFFALLYAVIFYNMYFPLNKSYAKSDENDLKENLQTENVKGMNETLLDQKNVTDVNNLSEEELNKLLVNNLKDGQKAETVKKEEVMEYLTEYRTNTNIPKGISVVVQEGRQGKQEIKTKVVYDKEGNKVSEEQIDASIIKAPINKIVEIGGAGYSSNYKVKVKDNVYVTSDELAVWSEPSEESRKITELKQNDELQVLEITQNWYKVSHKNIVGWVKQECTIYINPNADKSDNSSEKSKSQLLNSLSPNMQLNKPSGLTLEQFKKILTDSKDKNKIFENNAEYFYYIEKQYNINGIFVAAIGIHESAWGTSSLATQKNNLFGYGAYDSNPYNGAYTFTNYSESIDLLARVLVKYYLNPAGTSIYGGEKAVGSYYNGATLSGVNKKYATDNNWANAVYSYMKILYNKI